LVWLIEINGRRVVEASRNKLAKQGDRMSQLICYCFEYTEDDIINDFRNNHGKSAILERITEARKNNTCQCDDKHPEKR